MDSAKNLSETAKVIWTEDVVVACEGDGAQGHPKVFYNLSQDGRAICGYCNREFRLKTVNVN